MARLILGSQSPRRREILGYFGIPFEAAAPPYDEEIVPFSGNQIDYVCTLSKGKAASLVPTYPDDVILTADTIVFRDGKIYGKPRDSEEAFQFLSELVGQWHTVYTGVTVRQGNQEFYQAESTRVQFNDLSPDQIRHYISRIPLSDKAGGYAIQGVGGLIVNRIEGCYYNVMGLPINTVHALLKHVHIDLWNYI